jgi:hypothetical protein
LEAVIIEITKIDVEKSTISGKTKAGQELSFRFLPTTRVRRLKPIDLTRTMGELRLANPHSFPLGLYQEVGVEWKVDAKTADRIAVSFTIQ